ncbi:heavy metal-associated domain-containing protein [Vibrio lentus]|nr:heavy metal-associated domain-containing protein [Vibrio lentus]
MTCASCVSSVEKALKEWSSSTKLRSISQNRQP